MEAIRHVPRLVLEMMAVAQTLDPGNQDLADLIDESKVLSRVHPEKLVQVAARWIRPHGSEIRKMDDSFLLQASGERLDRLGLRTTWPKATLPQKARFFYLLNSILSYVEEHASEVSA